MCEYDMAVLFLEFFNHALSFFELFIAAFSAVLVVGYIVGATLTRTMVVVIIGLFTLVTIVCGWHVVGAYSDGAAIAQEIGNLAALPGSKLHWMFRGNPPNNFSYFAPILAEIASAIGVIITLG